MDLLRYLQRGALLFIAMMAMGAGLAQAGPVVVSDHTVVANAIKIHYLQAGTGDKTVILLHGWPESSHEFHKIVPDLARDYTVIVPDLRGVGGTQAAAGGYDKATMAEDIYQLVQVLGLKNVYLVGHDTGGMLAYAYLRLHPDAVKGIAIVDVPVPGIAPWDAIEANPCCWHFRMHQAPGFAEAMVQGREDIYFRHSYTRFSVQPGAISDEDVAIYVKAYSAPESLHAGFEYFRAFAADAVFNQAHKDAIAVPVLLAGGDHSMGPVQDVFADALRALGVAKVEAVTIAGSGHWVPEEQPQALVAALRTFIDA